MNGMIAASGDVQISWTRHSFIVAGGDIKKVVDLDGSIIICDGDVELRNMPSSTSLIVARGKVTCVHGPLRNGLIRSGHTLHLYDGKTIDLTKNGAGDPFAFVKFFELADLGITAEDLPPHEKSDALGVLLKEVRKDSPFANGLRPGDRIIALEEKKTTTTEIFRRILRRKLAEDEPTITFTVRHSGRTLDVPIPMKH
jgi:membrane-associated protease RseP (regulator of RpoE activity)